MIQRILTSVHRLVGSFIDAHQIRLNYKQYEWQIDYTTKQIFSFNEIPMHFAIPTETNKNK